MGSGSHPFVAQVLTLYPGMFPGGLDFGIVGRAKKTGLWSLGVWDMRSFCSAGTYGQADDTPFGGGSSMVLCPQVVGAGISAIRANYPSLPIIYPSPTGKVLDQRMLEELSQWSGAIFVCGRFEGIDERVYEAFPGYHISMGDYVMAGAELPTMSIVEACVRLLPGVAGNAESIKEESFQDGLLEYPQYTKPRVWKGMSVPDVLLTGHHKFIKEWRRWQSINRTRSVRPDLWRKYNAS